MKVKVAVIGAAGYAGEELLRLLLRHPVARITRITSRQYAGKPVGDIFPRFLETDLCFTRPEVKDIAENAELAFLALPHGLAAEYAIPLLEQGLKVVDISADFRIRDPKIYQTYYKTEHPAPELLKQAVYGAPERYGKALRAATLVACPGCYPTSITLPTCPVLKAGLAETDGIIVSSMSGVSGAGRKADLPLLFAECNESVRPYKITGHRHLPEIEQELQTSVDGKQLVMNFVPHLVPIIRGIHSTIFLRARDGVNANKIGDVLNHAYRDAPFVRVLPAGKLADTKNVVYSNVCEIGWAFDQRTRRIILSSAIDNLTKGASGQAIQCMNLILGLEETTGLL